MITAVVKYRGNIVPIHEDNTIMDVRVTEVDGQYHMLTMHEDGSEGLVSLRNCRVVMITLPERRRPRKVK